MPLFFSAPLTAATRIKYTVPGVNLNNKTSQSPEGNDKLEDTTPLSEKLALYGLDPV